MVLLMIDRKVSVSFDTEIAVLGEPVEQPSTEAITLQEEILDEIKVTNGLLGLICAFLLYFSIALVAVIFYKLIRYNVTHHIR